LGGGGGISRAEKNTEIAIRTQKRGYSHKDGEDSEILETVKGGRAFASEKEVQKSITLQRKKEK